ncbi:hypothetical protein BKA62DRAFT_827498 [Auriculariales sp. MPI-PUGE-AT-0066]|nr:hypothetical protein BKA62DRAFT_827498 [Auriculariales sp. MPI-PUGE-AT-0066]
MTVDFAEMTTSSFLLGLQPADYHSLLAQAMQSLDESTNFTLIWDSLLNAFFDLFSVYPADRTLIDYLNGAIEKHIVPLHYAFSYSLTNANRMHDGATLYLLFQTFKHLNYTTGSPLYMFPYNIPELVVSCLTVLRGWQSLVRPTVYGPAPSPVAEMLLLLLSAGADASAITTAQAAMYYNQVAQELHLLQTPDVVHLDDNLRAALDSYMLALRIVVDDNAKAAQEVELFHAIQFSLSKSTAAGSASDVELTSMLLHLFDERASELSFGNLDVTVAILRALLHHLATPLSVFFKQVLLGGLNIIARRSSQSHLVHEYHAWCSIVTCRIPTALIKLAEAVVTELPSESPSAAVETALREVHARSELLQQVELPVLPDLGSDTSMFPTVLPVGDLKVWTSLLTSFMNQGMLGDDVAESLGYTAPPRQVSGLQLEAEEHGQDLQAYLAGRLGPDTSLEDSQALLGRAMDDYHSHAALAGAIQERFVALASAEDVEPLSHLCKALSQSDAAVDILCLYGSLSEVLGYGLVFVKGFSCEGVGDPQTAITQFGTVVLFLQLTFTRYQLSSFKYTIGTTAVDPGFLLLSHRVYAMHELLPDEGVSLQAWFKAVFSRDSEGIDDHILRTTPPLTLLRIAPTLFSESLALATAKAIDLDAIRNGCQFFFEENLNWTLVGVVKSLTMEINSSPSTAAAHFEVLKLLIEKTNSLPTVIRLCRPSILRISPDAPAVRPRLVDLQNIRKVVESLSVHGQMERKVIADGIAVPHAIVREALRLAVSGGPAGISTRRCLTGVSPASFLEILWADLQVEHATNTSSDVLHRVAANALVASALTADPRRPVLLPLFLLRFVPLELVNIQQTPFELNRHASSTELLALTIMSAMSLSFHLERALNLLAVPSPAAKLAAARLSPVALAHRLAAQLRGSSNPLTADLRQRLGAKQSFVTMFPDLGLH